MSINAVEMATQFHSLVKLHAHGAKRRVYFNVFDVLNFSEYFIVEVLTILNISSKKGADVLQLAFYYTGDNGRRVQHAAVASRERLYMMKAVKIM